MLKNSGLSTLCKSVLTLAALVVLAVAPSADAAPILVINSGFEAPTLPDGGFSSSIPGWTSGLNTGTFNPTTAQYPGQAPEGQNVAFIGPVTSSDITQVLSSNLAVGTYTLRVDVGARLDFPYAGYNIQLLAGSTVLAGDSNTLTPAAGTFVTSTVSFTALAGNPALGQPLQIRLAAPNAVGNAQTNFDDVRLDFNPTVVPEPSGLSTLSMGLAGLFLVAWRRRRQLSGVGLAKP